MDEVNRSIIYKRNVTGYNLLRFYLKKKKRFMDQCLHDNNHLAITLVKYTEDNGIDMVI